MPSTRNQYQHDDNTNNTPPAIPPPLPPFRSVSMIATAPAGGFQVQQSHPVSVKQQQPKLSLTFASSKNNNTSGDEHKWVWKVAQLDAVPLYHPLERTAITCTSESLDTVTKRISNFMSSRSIHCQYHAERARVDCSTEDLLLFVVQLWKKNNAIIIEVQRRQGCCIAMQTLRHNLSEAILFGEETKNQASSMMFQRTCSFLHKLPMEQQPPQEDCSIVQCVELCQQLLTSDLLDRNRLGLESLCILTDLSKVQTEDAKNTSTLILSDPKMHNLLQKFFQEHNSGNNMEQQIMEGLHLLAFKTLAQALEVVQKFKYELNITIDLSSPFWKAILNAGYENIQLANQKPIEASLSIRCLRLLQAMEPLTLSTLQQQNWMECLQNAHEYGRQHNRSLQQETELLMMEDVY